MSTTPPSTPSAKHAFPAKAGTPSVQTVTLGDVVEETQYGTSLKANGQGQGVPVLRMGNITYSGALDLTDLKHVEMPAKDLAQYSVRRGDLLFNRTNSQELVGKMAVWNLDEQFAFAGYLVRLRLKSGRADPAFVSAWFNTPEMKTLLRTRGKPSINMSNINATEVLKFPLPLPPLAEQRRIAEVLDRAEALRAKRRAALAELDSLTQSLFLDLFGDPASPSLMHPVSPLESILHRPLQNGAYYPKEAYSEDGVEMVHMSDAFYEVVPRGGLKRVICPQSDVEKYSLTEADILIARRSLTLEGAAKPCLIPPSSEPLIFESSFIRVTPAPAKVSALYLYHYLGNERVKQKCVQPFITQSTISGINQSNLERVPVVVPPIALQQEFARRVGAVEKLKQAQRAALAEQDALFATLQHRAFRGEL